jgi:Bardet-Biedl syndrome 5 protein
MIHWMHQVVGVWNLSADQGNLGTLYITNVRVVWFANLAENFNVSIPHIQVVSVLSNDTPLYVDVIQKSVRVRESKFGLALVIDTLPQSGGYILGFKIDPKEKLYEIAKEIQNVHDMFLKNPVLGVPFSGFEEVLEATTLVLYLTTNTEQSLRKRKLYY